MIEPLAGLAASDIEYKGLTEKGVETPWTAGGAFCGTRQLNLALCGFSIRIKGAKAKQFSCEYRGLFRSGDTVGPVANGQPLRSKSLDDALQAIELSFLEVAATVSSVRQPQPQQPASAATRTPAAPQSSPHQPLAALAPAQPEPPLQLELPKPRGGPKKPVGPRFSVFREDGG